MPVGKQTRTALSHRGRDARAVSLVVSDDAPVAVAFALVAYVALIIYASLFPWRGWTLPTHSPWQTLFHSLVLAEISRRAVVVDLLSYAPLGLLLSLWLNRSRTLVVLLWAALAGAALGLAMEAMQSFLPSRTPDAFDALTNAVGAVSGASFGLLLRPVVARAKLSGVRATTTVAVAAWAMSVLSPFVPVWSYAALRANLAPTLSLLHGGRALRVMAVASSACSLAGLLLLCTAHTRRRRTVQLACALAVVLLLQPFVFQQSFLPESLIGLAVAFPFALAVARGRSRPALVILLLAAGFILYELEPLTGTRTPFNWVPFALHLEYPLTALGAILADGWPFFAMGTAAILCRHRTPVLGAAAVATLSFTLEWLQTYIPGRHGDITVPLIATFAWTLAYLLGRAELYSGRFGIHRKISRTADDLGRDSDAQPSSPVASCN